MKIIIGCDHAGYSLKNIIKDYLIDRNVSITDIGTESEESVDYPDYGFEAAKSVAEQSFDRGILICGSGIGMSMVANKVPGIRAALCMTSAQAVLSRQHNDSNILVLAGRMTEPETAKEIVSVWLDMEFEGGRHIRRVKKIHDLTGM